MSRTPAKTINHSPIPLYCCKAGTLYTRMAGMIQPTIPIKGPNKDKRTRTGILKATMIQQKKIPKTAMAISIVLGAIFDTFMTRRKTLRTMPLILSQNPIKLLKKDVKIAKSAKSKLNILTVAASIPPAAIAKAEIFASFAATAISLLVPRLKDTAKKKTMINKSMKEMFMARIDLYIATSLFSL